MPQQTNRNPNKTKKKGRAPAHQNKFAFHHNPKSKKTDKILASPNLHVCQKCHDKIEWRKKYRKYKPLTQPKTCNICKLKKIKFAYHTICGDCHISSDRTPKKMCRICTKEPILSNSTISKQEGMEEVRQQFLEECHKGDTTQLTLRETKRLERKMERHLEREDTSSRKTNENDDRSSEKVELELSKDMNNIRVHDDDPNTNTTSNTTSNNNNDDDDEDDYESDEDDPFLKAIGGSQQLLVGEAYQQMLLQKQTQAQSQTQ